MLETTAIALDMGSHLRRGGSSMKLQRFNSDGIAELVGYRASLLVDPTLPPPFDMLEDPALTEPISSDVDVPKRTFANRLEAGQFLNDLLDAAQIRSPERDRSEA